MKLFNELTTKEVQRFEDIQGVTGRHAMLIYDFYRGIIERHLDQMSRGGWLIDGGNWQIEYSVINNVREAVVQSDGIYEDTVEEGSIFVTGCLAVFRKGGMKIEEYEFDETIEV